MAEAAPEHPGETALRDRRLTPARPDVAAAHLEGRVESARFVEPRPHEVRAAFAALRPRPEPHAPIDTMLLFGETFDVYDARDGWLWGQARDDGYVGYVHAAACARSDQNATHRVVAPMTHLYPAPDFKTEPVGGLYMTSRVAARGEENGFVALAEGLYAPAAHLAPEGAAAPDVVAAARLLLHAPYLWGGKTVAGVDCSGLIQVAMQRAGLSAPRDSDMQERDLGAPVDPEGPLRRGDLVFWKGHVGIMVSSATLLHANIHHMQVAEEPLADARARIMKSQGLEVTSVRRLPALSV